MQKDESLNQITVLDWAHTDLHKNGRLLKISSEKATIPQLKPEEVIIGEKIVFSYNQLKLDHNLPRTAAGYGRLVCTNFKIVFLPYDQKGLQMHFSDEKMFESLHTPQAKAFFSIQLGRIYKVESVGSMGGSSSGASEEKAFVEIVSKDGRKFSITCKNYVESEELRDRLCKQCFTVNDKVQTE